MYVYIYIYIYTYTCLTSYDIILFGIVGVVQHGPRAVPRHTMMYHIISDYATAPYDIAYRTTLRCIT